MTAKLIAKKGSRVEVLNEWIGVTGIESEIQEMGGTGTEIASVSETVSEIEMDTVAEGVPSTVEHQRLIHTKRSAVELLVSGNVTTRIVAGVVASPRLAASVIEIEIGTEIDMTVTASVIVSQLVFMNENAANGKKNENVN